jgi:hypothetical protein
VTREPRPPRATRATRAIVRHVAPLTGLAEEDRGSPDPDGRPNPLIFKQLAVFAAGSSTPLLGFAGLDVRVCWGLLTQMLEIAGGVELGLLGGPAACPRSTIAQRNQDSTLPHSLRTGAPEYQSPH